VNVRYDEAHTVGTDSMVQEDLAARCKVTVIAGMPQLYTYVFHGSNLRTRAHHERLLRRKAAPSRDVLPRLDAIIQGLREYLPYPVELFCSDVWRFRLATGRPAPAGAAAVAGSIA
jgi:hypothetical protein